MKAKLLGAAALVVSSLAVAATPPPPTGVDPQEAPILAKLQALGAKPFHTLTPQKARLGPTPKDAVMALLQESGKPTTPEHVAKVEDKTLPRPGAALPIRVYTPEGAGPFPALVYFHGGGFVVASKDLYDSAPRALANQAKAVVVSVDYRLAPENKFPAALDDATASFLWVREHAKDLNVDPNRVAVGGESAGANLATAVGLREKRLNGPEPVFQLLVYPFVSNDVKTQSHQDFGKGSYLIGNDDIAWFWKHDLGPAWENNKDPEALPIYATASQLAGSPPALVITAGLDPLRDEGNLYAQHLRDAGIKVDVKDYPGVTHEFFEMNALVDRAKDAQRDAAVALRKAFATVGVGGSGQGAQSPNLESDPSVKAPTPKK